MRMLFVFVVVMSVFFGYMYASAVGSVARANDAVDLMVERYVR
jgi:hypothetical protein